MAAGFTGPASSTGCWSTPGRACPPADRAARVTTLEFTHLQFEALLIAARESANPNDFALVAKA